MRDRLALALGAVYGFMGWLILWVNFDFIGLYGVFEYVRSNPLTVVFLASVFSSQFLHQIFDFSTAYLPTEIAFGLWMFSSSLTWMLPAAFVTHQAIPYVRGDEKVKNNNFVVQFSWAVLAPIGFFIMLAGFYSIRLTSQFLPGALVLALGAYTFTYSLKRILATFSALKDLDYVKDVL